MPRRSGLIGGKGRIVFALFVGAGVGGGSIGCAPAAENDGGARPPRSAIDTVEVALLEYAIGMPTRLAAGTVALRLSNQGFEIHNLKLFPSGANASLWETATDLDPGQTEVFSVELSPGAYSFRCDVSGHDMRGMQIEVEVVEREQ